MTFEKEFKDKIFNMDAVEFLKTLPDNSIDCCVTSPPYYNLREYGVDGQIGLEETPLQYLDRIVDVFSEVHRVLKSKGTLWLNIGDTYNGTKLGNTNSKWAYINSDSWQKKKYKGCKHKDLLGIPWMVAFALRDKVGFYLRNDIIWAKDNCMPESVTDRCTKSHEYIFLFAKSEKYYFDYEAIQEDSVCKDDKRFNQGRFCYEDKRKEGRDNNIQQSFVSIRDKRNKRDVWHVNTRPDTCAHFAVYPEKLVEPCILAGCPKDGIVLDPFMGSGTTARVAKRFGRHYTGSELNPEYIQIIEKKMHAVQAELFT